jgi:hypothetical protein
MKQSKVVSKHVSSEVSQVKSNSEVVSSSTVTLPPATLSLAARVAAATQLVQQAMATLALVPVNLSAKQVKFATKFVNGGEDHLGTLASLSAKYRVEVPTRPTAVMTSAFADAKTLEPLQLDVQAFSKLLEDSIFQGRSETWTTATTLYSMLGKASAREPTLKKALAPTAQFFRPSPEALAKGKATRAKKAAQAAGAEASAAQATATLPTVVSDAPVTAKPTVVATPVVVAGGVTN